MRPAAYVVTAGDLTATTSGNSLCKFADDIYLIIPASNEASRPSELVSQTAGVGDDALQIGRRFRESRAAAA